MDKIQQFLTMSGAIVSLFIALITFVLKFVKSNKVKKALNETLKISEAIAPMIIKAEEFLHYTGEEKKQYVLTKANRFAIDNKLSFDLERVSLLIDELVETTKKVNGRDKDLPRDKTLHEIKKVI